MRHDSEHDPKPGTFDLGEGTPIAGSLRLAGVRTAVELHSPEYFETRSNLGRFIKGQLANLTKVSLIDCISAGTGTTSNSAEKCFHATVYPHFVVAGHQHLDPKADWISETSFLIDDATTLFYDFDAFGSVIDARPLIRQVVDANKLPRAIETGEMPQIHYFTGKREIFFAETAIGRISAFHSPSWSLPSPNGLSISNKIRTRIAFTEPIRFVESIDRILTIRELFGLLVGRPQNLSEILVVRTGENGEGEHLRVHWSRSPKRRSADGTERPHCADVLIDLVRNPIAGGRVLQSWIAREEKWRIPRSRFFSAFENRNYYTAERLVAAANMFDVLPIDAVPSDVALSPELAEAKAEAQQSFRRLEQSQERDSVLSALGRIGKASLKQKVRHRAQLVANSLPQKLPEITTILDTAVDFRNHLVHGSPIKLPSQSLDSIMYLLTDTLEFIFGASDLVESGWDITEWDSRTSTSHPFGRYLKTYIGILAHFKSVLRSAGGAA